MQIHIYSHADPFWNTKYKYSRNIVKVYGEFIYFICKFESPIADSKVNRMFA